MLKTLGIGMVGARLGARLHIDNYGKLGGAAELRGVCASSLDSAGALARSAGIGFVTTDYAALLARSDIDAVDICVPPALHHTFAPRAIEAGKHHHHGKAAHRESHAGSSSVSGGSWQSAGGGALLRMGVHSGGACLQLERYEGEQRLGRPIAPVAVLADTADLVHTAAAERARSAGAHRWISANPVDVETWPTSSSTFDDATRAIVNVNDIGLGGLHTRVTATMTDVVVRVNMTANDALETYAPDPGVFGDEYFSERLETRAGWQRPSCDEGWFRGFAQALARPTSFHGPDCPRYAIRLVMLRRK